MVYSMGFGSGAEPTSPWQDGSAASSSSSDSDEPVDPVLQKTIGRRDERRGMGKNGEIIENHGKIMEKIGKIWKHQ